MKKLLPLLVLCLAITVLIAGPAAAQPLLLTDGGTGSNGAHRVQPQCAAALGVSTELNTVTYVVTGRAHGSTTDNHAQPVGTSMACSIRNAATGQEYGRVSGGLPGSAVVVAGKIKVPNTGTLILCAYANAVFTDNHTASFGGAGVC
ncbi:MAG: hypothetical protein WD770_06645 [Actinomycetota bacterium]